MNDSNLTYLCIICGRDFRPRDANTVICPACGGPPEAPAPSQPQGTVLVDQPKGTVLAEQPKGTVLTDQPCGMVRMEQSTYQRLCILCGRDFVTSNPHADHCPQCRGEEIISKPEGKQGTVAMRESDIHPTRPSLPDDVPLVWNAGDVILDLYEVKGELGKGGMGVVYRVHHRQWHIDLAVKTPLPDVLQNAGGLENFVREAQTWVDLGLHPHIVTCYYVRRLGEVPRVFAECMEGGSLKDWIKDGRLYVGGEQEALKRILDVGIQFAWGLGYAHERGLVHQDVKPGNAMMTPDGMLKVTDFGLVGAKGYTEAYAAPEQELGQAVSPRTDIWGWGVSVLEMFTGEVHWGAGSIAASVLENYLEEAPPEGVPPMPGALAELLRQCFQNDPALRPASMDEVAERLIRLYEQETGASYPRQKPKTVSLLVSDLNNRALSYLDLGKKAEAEGLLKEAVENDPAHPEAVYNSALLEWQSGRIDDLEVVRRLEELCKRNSGEWLPVCLLANIHLDRGDNERAIHKLEKVKYDNAELEKLLSLARKSTGSRCRIFEGHEGKVNSVCFSPDGKYVLSGSNDKTLRIWNVGTTKCLRTFEGHEGGINSVCFSSDGRYALSGSDDETLKLWSVVTGRCLRTFERHKSEVNSVCFSPDGSKVLSGSRDGTIKLWDMKVSMCLKTLDRHELGVQSVSFSPNGKYVLSGGGDKKLKIWDISTDEHIMTFGWHSDIVLSVCFSPDGNYALSASCGETTDLFDVVPGELLLWDVLTGKLIKEFKGHKDIVSSACFSPDGRFVLSGSYDKTLKLWDLETGRCIRTFEGHGDWVTSVCFSPDGMYALSGSCDHNLYLWSLERIPATLRLAEPISSESAISSYRKFKGLIDEAIITADPLKRLQCLRKARAIQGFERAEQGLSLWLELYVHLPRIGLRASWELRSFHGHKDYVKSACFSPDGNYALSGSKDETLRLFDIRTGECLRTLRGHKKPVNSVCFSPDGRYLLSGSYNEPPKLWDIKTGECLRNFEEHAGDVRSVCFSPNGRYAISAGSDFRLWRVETGECLITFNGHEAHVNSVCFSPDGRYILSGSADDTLKVWNAITGQCLRTFEGHEDEVNSVQFSPDGKYILSGSSNRTLKIWDVKSAKCIKTINGHDWQVESCCFSPDGKYVISGSLDKTIKLWDVLTGECLWTFVGHEWGVTSVCISPDASYILSGSADNTLKLWILDWELEKKDPADWDEGARPYLDIFLTLHTPYGRDGLSRIGKPQWTEEDFQKLLQELGYRGYGWLRPEGVRRELEKMAKERS